MTRRALLTTLYCTILIGFLPAVYSDRSSSERSPAPLDAAELLRDAPLYPPLRDSDHYVDINNLAKRNINEENNDKAKSDLVPDFNSDDLQPFFDTNEFNDEDSIENTDVNEVHGVDYDDPETSIEDSSILVTPEESTFGEFETNSNKIVEVPKLYDENKYEIDYTDKSKLFENDYNDVTTAGMVQNRKLTGDVNNSRNIFSDGTEELKESNGFIVARGSNVDELNKILMAEESRVQDDNKNFAFDESLRETILGSIPQKVTEDEDIIDRQKRSSGQEWEKPTKSRRVKTGDTILNIRGAVRDAIGDAGAAPGMRASSRVDAFVIRPAPAMRDEPRDQMREARRDRVSASPPQPLKQERELLVEPHAHARILCDLVNVTNLRWYKDNEQINLPSSPGGGESAWREGDAVEIPRASRGHAARWRCSGRDRSGRTVTGEPTRLLIYEPVRSVYLAVDGRRLDAGNTWVPVRDKTVLEVRCVAEGGVPPPELSWRLLALEPALDHRPYLRIHHTNYTIEGVSWSRVVVTAARELHNATLQCEARQRRPDTPPAPAHDVLTAKLEVHVTYPPSFVISRWPGFGISLSAGGAAALRCDVDANPPARATWMRDTDRPSSSPTPLEVGAEDGASLGSATLRWARLRESHAGWYRCRARWMDTEYSSIGYYLNVLPAVDENAQTTESDANDEEPDHQKVEVPLGGNVQLHCPKGSVGCWWRRVVGNSSESWAPAGSHHAHGVLGIKEALYEEGGEYRCVGARAPDLKRLKELKRVTLKVTGGATATAVNADPTPNGWRLECGACGRNLRVLWLRGGRSTPAILTPDLAQHCWKAVLLVPEPDEVWCVAVSSNGGAVAVFPRRSIQTSPSPARHAVRALHGNASHPTVIPVLYIFALINGLLSI
ncbi:uncharacterized protein LOC125073962 isoform X1 [Vanessa atalanta]|uniref:uncharacterized protein LOC125073962 isoform X1 n=1 Tax=Vanessa atalanta TaxID=42275 RepID=UPI001FCDAAE1|nr:uncharacterized protein LOC125073962 isoform X1 [Vanessa atalanta]XP_047541050.1 uncharacterized protein LOC125073962 isoform X1 [Vanessa atalanta]